MLLRALPSSLLARPGRQTAAASCVNCRARKLGCAHGGGICVRTETHYRGHARTRSADVRGLPAADAGVGVDRQA
jgi:hypothetical protein